MNRKGPRHPREAGLTLIELLVVIVVLGVLATLVAPSVFQHVGSSRSSTARAQIEMIGAALDAYQIDSDDYPSTDQGLAALRATPTGEPRPRQWRGPYLRKSVPLDPWGRPYVYRYPGQENRFGYDLLTLGKDGKVGGQGEDADVRSWD